MDVLDQPLVTSEQRVVQYAGFGVRLGAMIIDSLIIGVVTLAATYYNIFTAKSTLLLIIVTLVSTAYKPLMEYFFGATVGKMALRLKVVNTQLDRADFSEIFLRNIFNIIPSLITLVLTVDLFNDPEFQSVSGFMEYSLLTQQYTGLQFVNYMIFALTVVDAIVLLSDKFSRSLHDKIGKTFVIRTS